MSELVEVDSRRRVTLWQHAKHQRYLISTEPDGVQSVEACAVTVPGDEEDWVILWAPHETEPGVILVPYVGPASFA